MERCRLTITTNADGQVSTLTKDGAFVLGVAFAEICYEDGNASVAIKIENGCAHITRKGDYTLALQLKKGERTEGALGIMDSEGKVYTKTDKLEYAIQENSVMLLAHYDLIVGGEIQKMQVRIFAKK